MFNIDKEFVERLKEEGYDLWTISLWEKWLPESKRIPEAIERIRVAFRDVKLGDGIGLLEANGMDDYANETELAQLRKFDERDSWKNIEPFEYGQHNFTPGYFDAAGFVFHLPGFLIAELTDEIDVDFIERIIERKPKSKTWFDLLTCSQAKSLVFTLSIVKKHPYYFDAIAKFDHAISRLTEIVTAAGDAID